MYVCGLFEDFFQIENHSINQKNLEKKCFFRIFWVSLRVLVSMESKIWVRAAPVLCGYGTRTDTVSVSVYTRDYWITYLA